MTDKLKEVPSHTKDIYDPEWVKLIIEAKQIGLEIHDIQNFLFEQGSS